MSEMTVDKLRGALDKLEAVQAEAERLRAALEEIIGLECVTREGGAAPEDLEQIDDALHEAVHIADQALSNEPDQVVDANKVIAERAMVDAVMNADPAYLPYSIRCVRDRLEMAREIGEE